MTFTSPVGIGPYICPSGIGIDGLLEASGVTEGNESTFIEVGPCSPEKSQITKQPMLHIGVTSKGQIVRLNKDEQFQTILMVAEKLV